MHSFNFHDKVLVLRFSRLGRIPPAQFSSELLNESGLPVLILEYGELREPEKKVFEPLLKLRYDGPWIRFLPKSVQFSALVLWVALRLSVAFILEGRPRYLIAHGASEGFLAWVLSSLFLIPYVIHAHEIYSDEDVKGMVNRFFFNHERAIFRHASFVIFPEQERVEIYRKRYGFTCPAFLSSNSPRKIAAPTPRDLRQELGLPSDSLLMGYIGGVGPDNLLEQAVQALTSCPKVHLLIWGWGNPDYLEKLQALARIFGIQDRYHYLGELKEGKWEALAGCDWSYCIYKPALLRMRHQATASNKLFEAMAAGIPSLTSSNPDFLEFISRYQVGASSPDLTIEGISKGIQILATNPALRKRLGQNGRQFFETLFHFERQFARPLHAYQDLYYGYADLWLPNQTYLPPATESLEAA